MRITNAQLQRIIKEELEVVLDEKCQKGYKTHEKRKTKKMFGKTYRNCVKAEEGLELEEDEETIEEITKRKFCQMMAVAGGALATGCASDYELLHALEPNEEGMPAPECIQNPQFTPSFDDPEAWTSPPVKLYEFMSQPVFGSDSIFVEDDSESITIAIPNVPITADIWNARHSIEPYNKVFSDEQILGYYTKEDQIFNLLTVIIKLRIYTDEDGEEFVAPFSDGGNWGTVPIRNTKPCSIEYEEWLGPRDRERAMVDEIVNEELIKYLMEKKKKAGTESSKESSLRDWFGRKGAKGKKKGWVDCNAPDGKGGYKSCGRSDGEKRSKYPSCRPTPGACKEKGKGKSWGKKAKKRGKKK
jgi:hypothetical protein